MDFNVTGASGTGNLAPLSAEKLKQLETVLKSILALPIAQDTYAQIIDGEPIQQPGLESIIPRSPTVGPSDGAMQQYEEIRKFFRVWKVFVAEVCKVDTKVGLTSASTNHSSQSDCDIAGPEVSKCAAGKP